MGALARCRSLVVGLLTSMLVATHPAAASEDDSARLASGRSVVHEENVERDGRRYVGGVSYIVIDAPVEEVVAALQDVRSYALILPHTRSARWVGLSRKGDALVEIDQGNAIAHGKYTVRVRRERGTTEGSAETIRFWLDRRYAHDLDDASGFFHVEPYGEGTMLTYVILVDLGQGLIGHLFESRVRRAALSTPVLLKRYVESRRAT